MLKAISVGRGDSVDVRLDDETVSRLHAELVLTGDNRFYLTDCMSTGGTFVGRDGAWVPVKQEYVDGGELLLFGQFQTTAAQLVDMVSNSVEGEVNAPLSGDKPLQTHIPTAQDNLPKGPVKRDPITGDIISIKD